MTTEFRDLLDRSVLIYLDDILVYRRTLDEHIVHLRVVLDRLQLAKYKANLDKCEFAKQELEYLGHFVTPKGIRPLADKIQAIVDWPEPRCTTDVRSFMGLAGYYRRFVESYSKVAAPLSRLQSPTVPFEFDDAARGAFTTLKAAMQAARALRIYDPTLPTQVTTDASGYGIGAVLEQCHEDGWHPVEYFSQEVPLVNTLDDARKKELLAFVTVLKRWRHFLLGRQRFKWNTDNNPLTFYKTQDTVTSTIGRWMYYIDQFNFDPCHIPGPANRAADGLSRRPDFCAIVTTAFDLGDDLQPHFVKGYKSDPTYSTLYAELPSDHPPASHYRISDGFLLLHTRGKDSPELARLLHTGWITNQRVSEDIVSDRDTRFMSAFWTSLMAESGATMKPSSARHPQTDGQTKRAHQTAQMMLRTLIRPDQKDWVDRLPDIEFAYNTSVHSAICITPFELHHGGEKARIFADLLLPQAADIDVPCSTASVRKYRDLLIKARANMQKAQIRMQQQANRRRLPCPFREGDLVWVLSEEFALEQAFRTNSFRNGSDHGKSLLPLETTPQARTLEEFVQLVYSRWHDSQGAQKITDSLANLESKSYRTVRELVLSSALKRWIEVIDKYDFKLDPLKREYNKVVDALSRMADYVGPLVTEFGIADNVTRFMVDAYREDPIMTEIMRSFEAKDKATSDEFVFVDGLLFLQKAGNKRLCIPPTESLRSLFLGECYDTTRHFDYKKTAAKLVQRFWWPTMMDDAKKYVETCQVCQPDKPQTQALLELIKPLPIPAGPGQSVSMDFMDTLVTSKSGERHIFVIVDRFSKYARLIAMPRTDHIIKLFMDNRVRDFDLSKSIVSDRDGRFTSELWQTTAQRMGTQLQITSGNHPESNGQAEQMNRVVQHLLQHYIKPSQDDCDEKLPLIANLYNNVVHNTTDMTPNQLHLGWKPRSTYHFLLPENQPTAAPGSIECVVTYEQLPQQVVEHTKKAQDAMVASENRHRRPSSFQVGDRVWVKSSKLGQELGISRKLMPQYFRP
ncbi:hypothetical protein CBR_g22452 [Chara braunii]|uniref:Integrase catalytic domain-containing protein n=1 Tax=Chara braunii TaxID=69332 RepID=A0A388L2V8_CHABU|nr:hypothetical protein CBR_g22452 [Chara braunii]|eukprot:GBG76572.1 hypothetical protein CBR_g22452 [Chara braunii]